MKSTFKPLGFLLVVSILLNCVQDPPTISTSVSTIEARVSTGLSILMALGLIYGSWRLMGMGRKD